MTDKTILITGCSTGFGRETALHFCRRGWQVFATVRKVADREDLLAEAAGQSAQGSDSMGCPLPDVFLCDITNEVEVAALAREVTTRITGLNVLLNNAGTGYLGPLEVLPVAKFRAQLEVNVTGHFIVTQALLPLLKAARGTLINVSSLSGRVTFPITGAYNASKWALEAMSDVLRMELAQFGVRVVVIEPGSSPTAIWGTGREHTAEVFADPRAEQYRALMDGVARATGDDGRSGFPVHWFSELVWRIANDPRPHTRYPIGRNVRLMITLHRWLPDRVWDWWVRRLLGAE